MADSPPYTYFWHDYETFGRVPRRDRPAQFAGLRTDAELQEVGTPVMVYCQPPQDLLPDPESCLLTGITPQHCQQHGLPERAFAATVLAALGEPGTIGCGYNTLRFDDEVSRHLFWRNLIDPYGREWRNGCSRWDLLDTVRCAWALRPEGIAWPQGDDGKPSFKLERLSAANGLVHAAAHDALSDVRATVALARLIRRQQPRLYDFCLRLRDKQAVAAEIGPLHGGGQRPFWHLSGMYGTERGCLALVWPLAPHPTNKNELIVWDLAHDPAELLDLDAATLRLRLFSKAADLPEGMTRLPVKTIHLNKSPVVIGNLKTVPEARAQHFGLDIGLGLQHAARAAQLAERLAACDWAAVYRRDDAAEPADVDQDLYGGFIGRADRAQLDRLLALPPERQAAELAARAPTLEDPRLDELLLRYRARHWPDSLSADDAQRWQAHRVASLHHGAGGGLSLQQYFNRLDELNEACGDDDARGQELLGALYEWAEAIAPETD